MIRWAESPGAAKAFKDEILFVTTQGMGIFCGAAGLWVNFSFFMREIPSRQHVFLVPFYLLILLPYGLAALSWLLMQHGERPADWYDEKQWRDMTRAALATLLLSLPGMALLLFARKPLGIFWFPNFVFLVLFLFSGCTLYLTFSRDS